MFLTFFANIYILFRHFLLNPYFHAFSLFWVGLTFCIFFFFKLFKFNSENFPEEKRCIHSRSRINSLQNGTTIFYDNDLPFPSNLQFALCWDYKPENAHISICDCIITREIGLQIFLIREKKTKLANKYLITLWVFGMGHKLECFSYWCSKTLWNYDLTRFCFGIFFKLKLCKWHPK